MRVCCARSVDIFLVFYFARSAEQILRFYYARSAEKILFFLEKLHCNLGRGENNSTGEQLTCPSRDVDRKLRNPVANKGRGANNSMGEEFTCPSRDVDSKMRNPVALFFFRDEALTFQNFP